ncbi:MAG: ribonuclease III [Clostridiales bacterium]|nr:ribonuclease III [Clostridiales bacterium]
MAENKKSKHPERKAADVKNLGSLVLAYMGDAVYEQFIRERVIRSGRFVRADVLHRAGVFYVNAEAQAETIKTMLEELDEEERGVVRRARNHRSATKPKNVDPISYKWATAFEALLGYLYLLGREKRLSELMERAAELVEASE